MNVLSLFDGMGGARQALRNLGVKVGRYCASEINGPSIAVASHNFPDIFQLGDINALDVTHLSRMSWDLVIFGSPCFTSDALVLSKSGYKNINEIQEGDKVLTHQGRWQRVLRVGSKKVQKLFHLQSTFAPHLFTTAEHPFFTRKLSYRWNEQKYPNGEAKRTRHFNDPAWVACQDLTDKHYLGTTFDAKRKPDVHSHDFWYFLGRFTGDGWLVEYPRKSRPSTAKHIYLCTNRKEASNLQFLRGMLARLGWRFAEYTQKNTVRIRIGYKPELFAFLRQVGKFAQNKIVHPDVFSLSDDKIWYYLKGLFDSDGYVDKRGNWKLTSVSKKLVLGVGILVNKAFGRPYRLYHIPRPRQTVIEGRVVNQRDSFELVFNPEAKIQDKGFCENGYAWAPIKKITTFSQESIVYNLEVEGDNSYTVDNVIVHNCTDLSVARKNRQSLAGKSSSLFYRAVDILNALRPKYFLMENVASMADESRAEITRLLGVEPVQLNSKYFTSQNRERLYWFNWKVNGRFPYPSRFTKHLLPEHRVSDLALSTEALIYMNRTSGSRSHWEFAHHSDTDAFFSACVVANFKKGVPYNVLIDRRIQAPLYRHFHPVECERLQGFPDDYSAGVAKTHRLEMIGNAFTVDVIQFLLRPIVYGYI